MLRIEEKEGKRVIIVPKGIRFISDWDEYNLNDFKFQHILDKKIPGCGYTEYCIRNNMNIILCSPRKILLENKYDQHKDEVFYFKNELDKDVRYDKDISNLDKKRAEKEIEENIPESKKSQIIQSLFSSLGGYIERCIFYNKPIKILVTYDSFRLVKEYLTNISKFDEFYTVIDEFQSLLVDSTFKSDTELDFMNQLNGIDKVCFVSATPMIDKYLKSIPFLSSIPYFELDWEKDDYSRIKRPNILLKKIHKSLISTARNIINSYINNNFETTYNKDENGNLVTIISTEAVFYVNSVNNILDIIKDNNLLQDQVNILCSNTPENKKKIEKKLGKGWSIGKVPLEHEPNKMFTFCTRTVYLGADMYSNCARTFILSDANINTLMVDISLDLPQIMGRQRNLSNPWKNYAEFYYKPLKEGNVITKKEFDELRKKKMENTESLLRAYNTVLDKDKFTLAKTYQYVAKSKNYIDNYVAVNSHSGNTLIPCINYLVLVSEERAFDIQQIDYKDRFSVFSTVTDNNLINIDVKNNIINFLKNFENQTNKFYNKMKFLCESTLSKEEISVVLDQIPLTYKDFYTTLGPERCKANGYKLANIKAEFEATYLKDLNSLKSKILSEFKVGERYLKSDIKEKLKEIYTSESYTKTPKANDLEDYFEVKECKISKDGKKSAGFEILKEKE